MRLSLLIHFLLCLQLPNIVPVDLVVELASHDGIEVDEVPVVMKLIEFLQEFHALLMSLELIIQVE
jgi:hypothetical protein